MSRPVKVKKLTPGVNDLQRVEANTLRSESRGAGSRKEMVSVEGLRFENLTGSAFDQSTYSVESCVSQNRRSSVSD